MSFSMAKTIIQREDSQNNFGPNILLEGSLRAMELKKGWRASFLKGPMASSWESKMEHSWQTVKEHL